MQHSSCSSSLCATRRRSGAARFPNGIVPWPNLPSVSKAVSHSESPAAAVHEKTDTLSVFESPGAQRLPASRRRTAERGWIQRDVSAVLNAFRHHGDEREG